MKNHIRCNKEYEYERRSKDIKEIFSSFTFHREKNLPNLSSVSASSFKVALAENGLKWSHQS